MAKRQRRNTEKSNGENTKKTYLGMVGAAIAGAVSMYLLDPVMGNRRRKLMKDQAVHLTHETEDMVAGTGKHMANKAKGLMHDTKSYVKDEMDQVIKSGEEQMLS